MNLELKNATVTFYAVAADNIHHHPGRDSGGPFVTARLADSDGNTARLILTPEAARTLALGITAGECDGK